ncbi:hypothetical protein GJ698_15120 [Pseudoduganella sp. FT26W]|uniref:Uncharacterized protein n=1 Tax=Duganella aquatilis TaxID=2666082 RepID=A0A844D6D4_9BURK|nr:hypothetical protein [Duganella aquatilis]MRW85415.1 hypothetical protein [Duganella aquatilis]
MRVIPPITITDSMLVNSSIVEVPPAMHAMGTTYAAGATASVGTVGQVITVYRSKQAGNVGHAPASSPDWWLNIGDTYAAYDPAATYGLGDTVIDPVAHLVYESQIAANHGQPLTTGTAWLDLEQPTNKWASFDQLRNTQAVAPVDVVQSIAPGQRVNSIAVIGLDARWVTITVSVGGVVKYTVTVDLSKRKSRSWSQYYFGLFPMRTSVQFFNLPPYRNATITVTASKVNGQRGVGGIILGNSVYLGEAQYEATSDHLNFSAIERRDDGKLKLVPERSVPKVDLTIWFDKELTSQLLDVRSQLNGRPAVWSGLDDFKLDYFEPLFIYGPHKEFSLNLKEFEFGVATLQVEEM